MTIPKSVAMEFCEIALQPQDVLKHYKTVNNPCRSISELTNVLLCVLHMNYNGGNRIAQLMPY